MEKGKHIRSMKWAKRAREGQRRPMGTKKGDVSEQGPAKNNIAANKGRTKETHSRGTQNGSEMEQMELNNTGLGRGRGEKMHKRWTKQRQTKSNLF